MDVVIKNVNVVDKDYMEERKFYLASYNKDINDLYVVGRLGYDMKQYKDVIVFLNSKDGCITYGSYSYFKDHYTIIRPVNSITVE